MSHQKVRGTHAGFDCAERMLDCLAPLAHLLRMLVEPALYGFEYVLMLSRQIRLLAGPVVAAVSDSAYEC